MARASKSAVVLCMNVGFSMSNSSLGEEAPFQQAKKLVQKFIQRQVFAESKNELGIVLFGTEDTKNPLAQDDQYQNICIHRHLMMADFELLEDIEHNLQPGGQNADWLDALVVCMDLLQKETMGKKYERLNIAVLTDLSTPACADQLDKIIGNLKHAGITLQFFLPFPVDADEVGAGDADRPDLRRPPQSGKGLSREQKQGLKMVRQVMASLDEEDGLDEVHTFSDALEKLSIFKRIERRPMAWPCQLTIGSSLSIRIIGYKAVCEEKIKKNWAVVDAESHRKDDVKRDTVYCLNDDNETEVQKDDVIQGFRYGSDIVPFSKVDQDQMKYKSDGKCFAVLGFTKQELVYRHQFMGQQVVKVFAGKDDEHAAVALSALIHALDSLKMVAIVRYVYDRRSNPQVGAAFPCIKDKYECLEYVQLPYMEDLRQYIFPSLENKKKLAPSEAQLSAVDNLISSMMLVEKCEDGEIEDIFKVNKIPNPQFQRLFQCLQHRGLNPDAPLPPMEPWLKRMLDRPQAVSARCRAPLQEMKKLFTLKEVVQKKGQKTSADVFGKSTEEPDTKKFKMDEGEKFSLAETSEGNVTSVGSVNPAENFCTLVQKKTIPFDQACKQLTHRMEQLLGNRSTEYYMKTIACIQAFREQSIKVSNADLFNSYMQSLKKSVSDKNLQVFWDLLVADSIMLISKDDVDSSTVSKQEANQFLTFEEKQEVEAVPSHEDAGDVDDLLDMM
ncbi:X-ray repair cross-complementing protein 5 isoform X1 [Tachysurus fulvidraco]|uniref:X-ray repair cross-complementing protein 5 isoform X1 n=2 Tax=Tachysurus fulvidraco TaxID=1234273 RepID=UPI001FEEA24D|nr:X-ray repair cross-complementing protein 5 isoform X1 [Tachysurus fulvidraco]